MKKIAILILLMSSISQAEYAVSIYDSPTYKDKSVVEIIDNCKKEHRLLISNKDLKDGKALEWLEKLYIEKKLDSCVKNIDN